MPFNFKLPVLGCLAILYLQSCAKTTVEPAAEKPASNIEATTGFSIMSINGIYSVLKITELHTGPDGKTRIGVNRTLSGTERDWQLIKVDNTYFKILNAASGKALTVVNSVREPELTTYIAAANQLWSMRALSSNTVKITSKAMPYSLTVNTVVAQYTNPERSYAFNGTMPRNVLESYLSRAVQMYEYGKADQFTQFGNAIKYRDDDKRMLLNIGAKFIGRVIFSFGEEEKYKNPQFIGYAKDRLAELHAADPEIIAQACIFEIVTTKVNDIAIPEWVFEAFGQPVINRNFNYSAMLYSNGHRVNQWAVGQSVPDITKLETRLWFYWLAKQFIDAGIESIHWGQVELMADMDKNNDYTGWKDILTKTRAYAATHARRKMVLCDGHVPGGGLKDASGRLLLDFHSFPLRPKEDGPQAQQNTILERGYVDAFYGRSRGGITPSGWICDNLPYLLELDSYGNTSHPGTAGPEPYDVWGYDEIFWFATRAENYRNEWLLYARNRIKQLDPNGFMILPGAAPVSIYRLNAKGPACPNCGNGEETVKLMWKNYQ